MIYGKQFISFQQIVKEIKELELKKMKLMYLIEFLNILIEKSYCLMTLNSMKHLSRAIEITLNP
ncbi:hypothetical protein CMV61_26280 [Escherichia coli]|nr:hypothetical protein CMV61_26280 [Escherichia coli]